ncbi:unnamed protein product [Periconia digitata]|uniref:Uncharacterized protein n=1 Tax=Periconia digitata TaxID=1303443 RepID=A0A9W4UGX2_9PLEO|nr:unnamed protein product [Periconia digitata]
MARKRACRETLRHNSLVEMEDCVPRKEVPSAYILWFSPPSTIASATSRSTHTMHHP